MGRPQIKTVHGYELPEVVSALQKAIRRGEVEDALYWAGEMFRSGYDNYVWSRLKVILSEDVGPGAPPGMVADVRALYENYKDLKADGKPTYELCIAHAVILLAESPKSHAALHGCMYAAHFSDLRPRKEMEDYVFDAHTAKGRRMGRDGTYFVEVSSQLNNEDRSHDVPGLRELWEHGVGDLNYDYGGKGNILNPTTFGKLGKPLDSDRQQKSLMPETEMETE